VRPMRALFQSRQIVAVKAPLPAIKRLSADSKVPTSPLSVPAIEKIEQHPLEPDLRGPAPHLPEARQLAGLGKLTPLDSSHPETLPSVTYHSERAQPPSRPFHVVHICSSDILCVLCVSAVECAVFSVLSVPSLCSLW